MATESDLRDLLRGPEPQGPAIDVEAVLRRARARRRPRVIAAGALGSLALVGVFTPVVLTSLPNTGGGSVLVAEESAADAAGSEESALAARPASAASLDACGMPLAEVGQDLPLALELVVPGAVPAGATSVDVEVTLRNVGTEPFAGVAGSPAIAFADAATTVLWHSGPTVAPTGLLVDLAPGASVTFTATFAPVVCGPEHDADGQAPPAGLPAAPAGSYVVRALIDVQPTFPDGSAGIPSIVGSDAVPTDVR